MTLTRGEIKQFVIDNTGKSNKSDLVETLCDIALKEAMSRHKFTDADSFITSTVPLTKGSGRLILPDGTKNIEAIIYHLKDKTDVSFRLILKTKYWFRKNVGTGEEIQSGLPRYGVREGNSILLDCLLDDDYDFIIDHTINPTFTSDTDTCPIDILDTFVAYYVVANVFLSIEDMHNFGIWMNKAVGRDFDNWLGGAFGRAVDVDANKDTASEQTLQDITDNPSVKPVFVTENGLPWYRP